MANSSMLVLPSSTAPAALKRSIRCASYGETKFERIFEPQVVSQSRATKMSLWATGIPVSGCPAPFAMSASAARACARLFSESMVMKAFSFPFSASMRARKALVSSALENFLCASPAASSLSEAFSMDPGAPTRIPLLDHLGNEIEPPLHLRRNRLETLALVALGHRVVSQ